MAGAGGGASNEIARLWSRARTVWVGSISTSHTEATLTKVSFSVYRLRSLPPSSASAPIACRARAVAAAAVEHRAVRAGADAGEGNGRPQRPSYLQHARRLPSPDQELAKYGDIAGVSLSRHEEAFHTMALVTFLKAEHVCRAAISAISACTRARG